VPFEPDCELHELCDVDTLPYKGVNIRALAVAAQVAPFTRVSILNTLKTTADAAVQGCTGGDTERQCSFYWYGTDYVEPETDGLMEQMNGLSAISSLLIETAAPPAIAPPEEEDDDEDSGDGDDDGESNGSNNGGGDDDDGDSENGSGEDSGDDEQGAGISSTGSLSFCILLSGLLTSVWFGSVL
jgi:mannan endo-1,6-alpha-mannosidase